MKLVVEEAESAALRSHIEGWRDQISSSLAEVEVLRAIRRVSTDPRVLDRVGLILEGMILLEIDRAVRQTAAALEPPILRTLDAIHLASALTVGSDLAAFVTYDRRLFAAALAAGLPALAPGQTPVE